MPAKITQEECINSFISKHGLKYDYSLVEYINRRTPVKIICPIHGIFEQTPETHKTGHHCPKCKGRNKTLQEHLKEAKIVHNNRYDYSLINKYEDKKKFKYKIICPIHGIFEQTFYKHINEKQGCPKCQLSKGELKVEEILKENKIEYKRQFYFKDCRGDYKPLKFDFYLPFFNMLIEYQGELHFRPRKDYPIEKFERQKRYDQIKREYCIKKNIFLLEINYDEDIERKLLNSFI
jgi:hypothetical protein